MNIIMPWDVYSSIFRFQNLKYSFKTLFNHLKTQHIPHKQGCQRLLRDVELEFVKFHLWLLPLLPSLTSQLPKVPSSQNHLFSLERAKKDEYLEDHSRRIQNVALYFCLNFLPSVGDFVCNLLNER